jgi:non-specific serine/threonine protein kinase
MLANLARRHGEYDFALAAFQELLAARRSAEDSHGAATTLLYIANVQYLRAAYAAGWACLDAARSTAGDQWDARLESEWRFVGGQLALHEGRHELARQLLTEELEAKGRHSGTLYSGYLFMNLGTVALEQGHCAEADDLLMQGLRLAERYGDKSLLAHSLECLSGLAGALGRHERALRLGSAAAALRESVGAPLSPAWQALVQRWLQASRTTVAAERARAACQTGQVMTLEEATAYAQVATEPTSASAPHHTARLDPLTAREQDVAALIAQGLSNRQIAASLVITERTVAAHVEHILNKLGFASRTQIGVWAAEHGLVVSNRA